MAFPKKNKTYLNKDIPTGEKGKKYIEELKKIRDDLENLKHLTDQVKKSKTMPLDAMNKINSTIKSLKTDVKKLNNDFPDLSFKIDN